LRIGQERFRPAGPLRFCWGIRYPGRRCACPGLSSLAPSGRRRRIWRFGDGETWSTEHRVPSTKYGVSSTKYGVPSGGGGILDLRFEDSRIADWGLRRGDLAGRGTRFNRVAALTPCSSPVEQARGGDCGAAEDGVRSTEYRVHGAGRILVSRWGDGGRGRR
jgi:hypothetical protein